MRGRHIKVLLWIWCILLFLSVPSALTADSNIQTIGNIRYSSGDNPLWSSLSFDDTSWNKIDKLTIAEKISPRSITWYRMKFRVPESSRLDQPALLIEKSSGADEIYLNGVKIGGEGTIGERFVGAPNVERLCKITPGLLKSEGENLLAVRVMATHLENNRFSHGICIDNYSQIALVKLHHDSLLKRIEVFILLVLTGFTALSGILLFSGRYPKNLEYFELLNLLYIFTFLTESLLFFETGLTNHVMQRMTFTFYALIPVTVPLILTYVFAKKVTPYLKAVASISVVLSVVVLVFFNATLYSFISYGWFFLVVACSVEALRLSFLGYKDKARQAGTTFRGSACVVAAGILSGLEAINIISPVTVFNESLPALGVPFFALFRVIAGIKDMISIKASQTSLSKRILNAHEEERTRLARELHDGLGQSFLAVKLSLQMIGAEIKKGNNIEEQTIEELISEVSLAIEDLRRISMDLRPASLEGIGISEIIKHYGMKCQADTGLKITVDAKEIAEVSPKIKDNLYRIYQETLANVIKHAGASEVIVTLLEKDSILSLEVKDNGKGFIYRKKGGRYQGIGLSTIQERVDLLNGTLVVESSPLEGTAIRVEAPIK